MTATRGAPRSRRRPGRARPGRCRGRRAGTCPDDVVVRGYLADAGDQLFAGIRESLYRLGVPAATQQHVRVEPARLGDDAGIRGALTAAVEEALLPHHVDRYVLGALGVL